MKRRQHREIMVFSISFLDVIASALGAILILFIVQYKKNINARVEIVKSEQRHVQCAKVLEWNYATDTSRNSVNEVVVTNKTTDAVDNTPFVKRGTATKPNSPNNNVIDPKIKKIVKPIKKIKLVDRVKKSMAPVKKPLVTDPSIMNVKSSMDVIKKSPEDLNPENKTSKIAAKKTNPPSKTKVIDDKLSKKTNQPSVMKAVTSKKEVLKLPPKPKRKALATCITSRAQVIVSFYDYDEPDGDSIMVTFNGRNATKLKLKKSPTKKFRFSLIKEKYNIISIKNLSNGFYPINTANVFISGCGKARWKMKRVGVTRVIYIYRK
jgi:hypothetical protein